MPVALRFTKHSYRAKRKSENMFTSFKSPKDFYSLTIKQLEYLLEEQRRQRSDLAELLSLAHRKLGYYKEDNTTLDEYETPPQTDSNDKSDLD